MDGLVERQLELQPAAFEHSDLSGCSIDRLNGAPEVSGRSDFQFRHNNFRWINDVDVHPLGAATVGRDMKVERVLYRRHDRGEGTCLGVELQIARVCVSGFRKPLQFHRFGNRVLGTAAPLYVCRDSDI